MIEAKIYVHADENGVFRVGQTRTMLDGVVYAFLEGHSPESIQQQYPAISLEEVYGAIAFYLCNREEINQYLARQEKLWDELRQKSGQDSSPVVQRLRALRMASSAMHK